jgi:hypothetical protein
MAASSIVDGSIDYAIVVGQAGSEQIHAGTENGLEKRSVDWVEINQERGTGTLYLIFSS